MGRRSGRSIYACAGFIYLKRRKLQLPPSPGPHQPEPIAWATAGHGRGAFGGHGPAPMERERPYLALRDSLSEPEKQVLNLLVLGQSNREIGSALGLSPGAVRGRLFILFRKLGLKNRTEAAVWTMRNFPGQQVGRMVNPAQEGKKGKL